MNPSDVAEAVEDVRRMLQADGADLVLLDADPKTDRIHLRLEFEGARCAECVLAPDMLRDTIELSLQSRVAGEFELVVDDPRRP
jgi:Fe-S cluster biogenesis protein NfuA